MTCPTVIRVTTKAGPPGIGLPPGGAQQDGFAIVKDGATPYLYKLVQISQVGLPQALGITASPTFAGLTLSGLQAQAQGLAVVGINGQIQRASIGSGLAIQNGALVVTTPGGGSGTVTSVGLSAPAGFSVSGSPVTESGTLSFSFANGYSLPTTAKQQQWDTASGLAATAVQEGDTRLTNSREWSAETISKTEAEEGLSTTRRAFNSLRVRESIIAWWQSTSGTVGKLLAAAGTQADARTALGLGTAATSAASDFATPAALATGLAGKADLVGGVIPSSQIPSIAIAANATAPITYDAGTKTIGISVGKTANTVAAGDDSRFAELAARIDAFRDAATFYVSKRITASDSNNGTSEGEPFLTIGAAVIAANAYVTANTGSKAKIIVGPGRFVESALPFRLKPNILAHGALQRGTFIEPAAGQELNGFWALDSGCMVVDFTFAGHQATGTSSTDSTVGTRAWAVRLNEAANGGAGVYLTASPYVKDCASITAEDDAGVAGSTSTGDTGGGVLVDGAACRIDSPIRSMVVYGFTQQNLGGPGAVIRNDAYAELVSFFGLFGTWHVQTETGGQATLSGGGCSEFGIYGLVADGYSSTPLFTGALRVAASAGALTVDVIGLSANRLGSSSRPAAGQIMLLGGNPYVVQSSTPINASGAVVMDNDPTRAGYQVAFFNPSASGLASNVAQGALTDFRQRSQISAGCHSANYVGSGTNYSALPWNGGVPIRGNEAVERNLGRVFGLIVNDVGDVKVAGGAFAVDGTTGTVTINTSQFNLSGLNAVGPFSRNGGFSTVGVQLQEVSNNATLLASTGISAADTVPTQFAVRSYSDSRFLAGLGVTTGQPITISDTSTQDGSGFWTRSRNIELTMNAPNGLVQLNSSGLIPSTLLPGYVDDVIEVVNLAALPAAGETGKIYITLDSNKTYRWSGSAYIEISASPGSTDAVAEGSVNFYFTQTRARQVISASGSLSYDPVTGVISYTAPTLAQVATSGDASDLVAGTLQAARLPTTGVRFDQIGLGTAAVSGWDLVIADSLIQRRLGLTAVAGVYTIDVQAGNEFVTAAAINGATTINLSNLANIPSGYLWRGVLTFNYTSGTISWFTGNSGYTVKWDGGSAMTPTTSETEKVVIEVVGGTTTIDIVSLKGRA